MSYADILFLSIALSMDAFAAALCKGLAMRRIDWPHTAVIALFFGGFQALMPFAGWLAGIGLQGTIAEYDHWIAFALLSFLGGKFIWDALRENAAEHEAQNTSFDMKEIFLMAVATSIDALAVGVTFAFLTVDIGRACAMIGLTTFCLSALGVAIGALFGRRHQRSAQIVGGAVLALIGTKILLEHLGILP